MKEAKKRQSDPKYSVSSIKAIIEQNDEAEDVRHIQQIKSLKDRVYMQKTSHESHLGPSS